MAEFRYFLQKIEDNNIATKRNSVKPVFVFVGALAAAFIYFSINGPLSGNFLIAGAVFVFGLFYFWPTGAYFGLSGHLFRFHPARRFGVIRPA